MNTTELAKLQDDVIDTILKNYVPVPSHIKKLRRNVWCKIAERTAPNNLVIRNLCILAIADTLDFSEARVRIRNMIRKLYGYTMWKEGYSYWLYTKPILAKFGRVFSYPSFEELIKSVDGDFVRTAYLRDGKLYPAPFGDVRDEPLEDALQGKHPDLGKRDGCSWMWREYSEMGFINYYICPATVGFNTHCPSENQKIKIIDGLPYLKKNNVWVRYRFYEGYDKKYKNKWAAFKDTFLNGKRWDTI